MKNYKKINVYSRNDFEEMMYRLDLNNDNVENQIDKTFIQILETPDCISYYEKKYGNEGNTHYWFNGCCADNVLNIAFDDVNEEEVKWNNVILKGISDKQAELIVNFIEKHKSKNFYISCRAGRSRAAAICRYLLDIYGEEYGYNEKESCRKENPCMTPNINVLTKLKRVYYKKFNVYES